LYDISVARTKICTIGPADTSTVSKACSVIVSLVSVEGASMMLAVAEIKAASNHRLLKDNFRSIITTMNVHLTPRKFVEMFEARQIPQ
jgi:hypothetical protein